MPIFRQNGLLRLFQPKFTQKWILGPNFKNLRADARSAPPRDYVWQSSVKIDKFDFFSINLGKLYNYVWYFGSNNVEGVAESGWRLKRAGWRWVHGLVIPIFLIWRKNDISFSRYLDFCAFVKSTDFKICHVIIGIASSGIFTYAYFLWILSTLKKKFGQVVVCCETNISDTFLAQDWRLETSSRLFYDFIKMTL